jgi:HEAT repeat protein
MTSDELARALAELGHARKAVQRPAAERLAAAAREDVAVRAAIATRLTSTDARERWGAAYALANVEPAPRDAMPALLDALASSDGDVRWAAARLVVSAIRHEPTLEALVQPLVSAESPLQRKMALYCLRDLAAAVAVDGTGIVPALGDVDPAVRMAAMAAALAVLPRTGDLAERIATILDDGEPGVRRVAAVTLGQLGVATPAVVGRLDAATASDDATLAKAARDALSRLGASTSAGR